MWRLINEYFMSDFSIEKIHRKTTSSRPVSSHRLSKRQRWWCACPERLSQSFSEWIIDRTGGQIKLSLVDLARFGVSRAKDLGIWGL